MFLVLQSMKQTDVLYVPNIHKRWIYSERSSAASSEMSTQVDITWHERIVSLKDIDWSLLIHTTVEVSHTYFLIQFVRDTTVVGLFNALIGRQVRPAGGQKNQSPWKPHCTCYCLRQTKSKAIESFGLFVCKSNRLFFSKKYVTFCLLGARCLEDIRRAEIATELFRCIKLLQHSVFPCRFRFFLVLLRFFTANVNSRVFLQNIPNTFSSLVNVPLIFFAHSNKIAL